MRRIFLTQKLGGYMDLPQKRGLNEVAPMLPVQDHSDDALSKADADFEAKSALMPTSVRQELSDKRMQELSDKRMQDAISSKTGFTQTEPGSNTVQPLLPRKF